MPRTRCALSKAPDLTRSNSWPYLLSPARCLHCGYARVRGVIFEGHAASSTPSDLRLRQMMDATGQKLTQSGTWSRAARRVFDCFRAACMSASGVQLVIATACNSGTRLRPSMAAGAAAPASSANVGHKSTFSTISPTVIPEGMPGPVTTSGTRISVSYAVIFPISNTS